MDQEGDRGQLDQPVSETPDDTARIREQIEHTRANLTDTIEELQDRLKPQHLVNQAGDAMRDAVEQKVKTMVSSASTTANRVAEQARTSAVSYPVPAALLVGGLAWLMMRSRRNPDYPALWTSDSGRSARLLPGALALGAIGYYVVSQRMLDRDASDEYLNAADEYIGAEYDYRDDYYATAGIAPEGQGSRLGESGLKARARNLGATAGELGQRAQQAVGDYAGQAGDQARYYGDQARHYAGQVGDQARQYAGQVGEQARQYAGQVGDQARHYAGQMGQQARHYSGAARVRVEETTTMLLERSEEMGENFDRWMRENPLTVGIAFFALGAVAGLSIPVTETEHRTLGAARQSLMEKAGQAVNTALNPA